MEVFYGSTYEYSSVLRILIKNVDFGTPLHWEDAFPSGQSFLESLLDVSSRVKFAVFLMSADDQLSQRGTTYMTPRDNLIFEAGMMIRALGSHNVILVYPGLNEIDPNTGGDKHIGIKHLTDLAGIAHLKCSHVKAQGSASEINNALGDVPKRIRDHLLGHKPSTKPTWVEGMIAIHHLETIDWYDAFSIALQRGPSEPIDPKLMYCGPGLAKHWIHMSRSDLYVNKDELFAREIKGILNEVLIDTGLSKSVCVIDLGVGNGRLGRTVLSTIESCVDFRAEIDYVAIDISQEMIVSAMRDGRMQDCLRSIAKRGVAFGICCDFYQLTRLQNIIPKRDTRMFLLLGNTLGNERDERSLLSTIRRAMSESDFLLLDVQLAPEDVQSRTHPTISTEDTFDTASFRCFGLRPSNFHVEEKEEKKPFGAEHMYRVKSLRSHIIYHPTISPLHLKSNNWYEMMRVRKYTHSWLAELFQDVGLKEVKGKDAILDMGDERWIFRYVVLKKA